MRTSDGKETLVQARERKKYSGSIGSDYGLSDYAADNRKKYSGSIGSDYGLGSDYAADNGKLKREEMLS